MGPLPKTARYCQIVTVIGSLESVQGEACGCSTPKDWILVLRTESRFLHRKDSKHSRGLWEQPDLFLVLTGSRDWLPKRAAFGFVTSGTEW